MKRGPGMSSVLFDPAVRAERVRYRRQAEQAEQARQHVRAARGRPATRAPGKLHRAVRCGVALVKRLC